jgi:hypothetical protein
MINGTVDRYVLFSVLWAVQGSAAMPGGASVNARGAARYGEVADGAQD